MLTEPAPRILVVDDERGIREGIVRILKQHGLDASMAADGSEALSMIGSADFPIVLLDLRMPGIDGFELIEAINEVKPGTICVVVSAFATIESVVKTTKMGTFDFVAKPFVPDDLMLVVHRAIDRWQIIREAERLKVESEGHLLQLSTEKSRLKTIMQSMGSGLIVVNIDKVVVLENTASIMILHRNKPCQMLPINEVIPDVRVCDEIDNLLVNRKTGQIQLDMGFASSRDSKIQTYVRVTLAAVRDEKDIILGVVILLADVTDSYAYEQMKNMFVRMVAHEVKAPIAAIESYLTLIENGTLDNDMEQIKSIASRCLERSGALLALVQDLLDITRQETLQRKKVIESLDCRDLIVKIIDFHRQNALDKNIKIEISIADNTVAFIDQNDMERIITNLLSNAIKYNRDSGSIYVRAFSENSVTVIEVEDTGIGLSETDRNRIGEEFFRVKNARTRMITGTGLGLSLVKRIVEGYKGRLEIESSLDKGSLFRVILPVTGGNA